VNKILVITDNKQDQVNGVVVTYKNLKEQARADGYSIDFIDPSLFKGFSWPAYPEVKISFALGIKKHIEKINPDYIHIATEGPIGVAGKLYCDKREINYTTCYHTKFPEYVKRMHHIPESITWRYMRWFHKKSSSVFVPTRSMAEELSEHGFKNLTQWTRGVDRGHLWCEKEYNHPNDPIKVVCVGRVSKEKNLPVLLELQDQFNITIVGDGPARKELERKYTAANFVGYKHGRKLAEEYARADVFVFPSLTDTFGIVNIEALAMGTPVVGFNVTGPRDIVQTGLNGYVVSNEKDLAKAIRSAAELERDRVQQTSLTYTWERCWQIFKDNLVDRY
tara:strand:+ start:2456 stop:3460 length:1005 start_codon:yes stop_codon:yes gene_type:complete